LLDRGFEIINEFFHAVKHVFKQDWDDHAPKTSRLLPGAGIIETAYGLEALDVTLGAEDRETFARGLRAPESTTGWTAGEWALRRERRRWNAFQNVASDIRQVSLYLVRQIKRASRQRAA
jgi:hypothetical protein